MNSTTSTIPDKKKPIVEHPDVNRNKPETISSASDGDGEKKKTHRELDAPKEKNEELERRTVFVGNVPKDMKKSRLKKIFSEFGDIETIRFRGAAPAKPTLLKKVAFRKNELHPDSGSIVSYIRFKTRKEAKKAAKSLNGHQLDEHYLCVDLAVTKKKKDNKKAVFVGNLHIKLHDNELRLFFANCGPIHDVRIIRDRSTQIGKGFGYVNFENSESVTNALKLDGTSLKNRPIRVKRAVKKEKGKQKRSQGVKQREMKGDGQKHGQGQAVEVKTEKKVRVKKEAFAGDCLSEIGKLKRKTKKPNKGELRKARIIHKLTGVKPKGDKLQYRNRRETKPRNK